MAAIMTEAPLRKPRPSTLPGLARFQLGSSLLWMLAGLALGIGMAATGDFALRGVHTHVQLLGWVTLCLTGLTYAVLPRAADSALALWHVALHNLGLPVMVAALAAYHSGMPTAEPFIALGSVMAFAGFVAFALAVRRAL
jgi:hypothetical protein